MVSACAVRRWLAAEVLDPGNIDAGFIRGIPPSSLRPSERWISTLSPVSSDTSPPASAPWAGHTINRR